MKHPFKFLAILLILYFARPAVLWMVYDYFRIKHFNILPDFVYWEVFFLCMFLGLLVKGINAQKIKEALEEEN